MQKFMPMRAIVLPLPMRHYKGFASMIFTAILSRWIHVISACLVIGGVFFIRYLVPPALAPVDDNASREILLSLRKYFKRMVHTAILLLIITGIFNTWLAWDKYKLDRAVLHPLWGTHILLAALAFSIALYVLAGPLPPKSHRKLMALNFAILLLAVAAASSLKWARERAVSQNAQQSALSSDIR
jgi:uncharacterized membrane protein